VSRGAAGTMRVRRAAERGLTDLGWLNSRHTFSFGDYYDAAHMGFSVLRVINDDRVAPGGGFPTHGHRDMEILSYVLDGELAHRDSTGAEGVIGAGEVQRMSAGTGIRHSERNASASNPLHFLQIWILPDTPGIAPGYEQVFLPEAGKRARLCPVATPDGRDASARLRQDAYVYAAVLKGGESVTHTPGPGRNVYVFVARGEAADQTESPPVTLAAPREAEILLFDLP
jgi:redox-sensitive bicupin YhaK (pirin superfamily)